MEKEEGTRKNSFKYYYEGYYYHKKATNENENDFNNFVCVRLSTYGCHGTARENRFSNLIEIRHVHNHPANFKAQSVSLLKKSILKKCQNNALKPKHIFDSTVTK